VLVLAAAAGAGSGKSSGGSCSRALPQGPAGLPAAVVVTTNCGRFRFEPDRSVVYEGRWKSPVPPVARGYWPDSLAWYGVDDRHLVIGRGMKRLWRSHGTYGRGRYLDFGALALGRRWLAFSYFKGRQSRLLVARYGGRERLIAHGETPLELAAGKLVTWRERGGALLERSVSGRLVRMLAAHAIEPQLDRESRLMVFRAARHLFVFDGARVRDFASLPKLGVAGSPVVEPLGRLVAVHDRRRLVIVGYDGRLFASTAVSRRGVGVASPVAPDSDGTAVAFTATRSTSDKGDTVYLLLAGAKKATPIFTESLAANSAGGCGASDWLAWKGRWLLYGDPEQRAAVVDSSGQAQPVELGDVIAQLPGSRVDGEGAFDIAWAA
jgi:hypothetical protein